jgi:hypothetical protein
VSGTGGSLASLSILFERLAELIDAIRVGKDLSFDAALASSRLAEFSGGQFERSPAIRRAPVRSEGRKSAYRPSCPPL